VEDADVVERIAAQVTKQIEEREAVLLKQKLWEEKRRSKELEQSERAAQLMEENQQNIQLESHIKVVRERNKAEWELKNQAYRDNLRLRKYQEEKAAAALEQESAAAALKAMQDATLLFTEPDPEVAKQASVEVERIRNRLHTRLLTQGVSSPDLKGRPTSREENTAENCGSTDGSVNDACQKDTEDWVEEQDAQHDLGHGPSPQTEGSHHSSAEEDTAKRKHEERLRAMRERMKQNTDAWKEVAGERVRSDGKVQSGSQRPGYSPGTQTQRQPASDSAEPQSNRINGEGDKLKEEGPQRAEVEARKVQHAERLEAMRNRLARNECEWESMKAPAGSPGSHQEDKARPVQNDCMAGPARAWREEARNTSPGRGAANPDLASKAAHKDSSRPDSDDEDDVLNFLRSGRYRQWKGEQDTDKADAKQKTEETNRRQWERAEQIAQAEAAARARTQRQEEAGGRAGVHSEARQEDSRKENHKPDSKTDDHKPGSAEGTGKWRRFQNTLDPTLTRRATCDELWGMLEQQWKHAEEQSVIRVEHIPQISQRHLYHMRALPGDQKRRLFKKMVVRFHPDKYMQKFGSRLVEKEKNTVLSHVKEIFQALSDALS